MEFLPQIIQRGDLFLNLQDPASTRRFLMSDAILKAVVIGLTPDKAVLEISGQKILAQVQQVPLTLGQVLEVQVKTLGDNLQLKILSTTIPGEVPVTTQQANLALELN